LSFQADKMSKFCLKKRSSELFENKTINFLVKQKEKNIYLNQISKKKYIEIEILK